MRLGNDHCCVNLVRHIDGSVGDRIEPAVGAALLDGHVIHRPARLSVAHGVGHHFNGLNWIVAISRLVRKHHDICPKDSGSCNVAHLSPGWFGVIDHTG